jgi:DNA-binding transcriptional regulator YhcF (GntR family)
MTTLQIKIKDTTITIEKPDGNIQDLFESFITAAIGQGYEFEEIEELLIDFKNK